MNLLSILKLPAFPAHATVEDHRDLHCVHPWRTERLGLALPFVHLEIPVGCSRLIPDLLGGAASKQQDKQITHTDLPWLVESKVYPAATSSSLGGARLPESRGRNFPAGFSFSIFR